MHLPAPIADYFTADRDLHGNAPTSTFTASATVTDEDRTHIGHAAIASWWRAAKSKYHHSATPLDMRAANGTFEVRAMVTGDFPGSPAPLTFVFRLDGQKIASLKIGV